MKHNELKNEPHT